MKKNIPRRKSLVLVAGLYVVLQMATLGTSCKHEALFDDITPIDTTGNPIDTTGPIDTTTHGTPCDPDVVYFETQVLPILISNCAKSGCHNAASAQEGVVLDNYANVMATGEINPFYPNDSKVYEAITEDDPEKRMPQPPAAALSQDQIATLEKWIQQGAKNLTCDPNAGGCDSTDVSYAQTIRPVINTHCKGCHSGENPSGGISFETYQGVKTVAQNGKLYGAISWANGSPKMPQGGNQLADCTIAQFKAWIDAGASEN